MTSNNEDIRLNDEALDEDVWLKKADAWLKDASDMLSATLSQPQKDQLFEDMFAMSDLVQLEVKTFGRKKSSSLNCLRDQLNERFGDKFDVAELDARVRKFIDEEFKPRKQTKRQRSPSPRRKAVSKKRKRKSSGEKKKQTKKQNKKKKTKKQTAKKKRRRKK